MLCKSLLLVAVFLFQLFTYAESRSADEINAEAFHRRAMRLVQEGNYQLALAHFRAACRHDNMSVLYWNDLGVTEMRMGELEKARRRFQAALRIDPTSVLALENIHELEHFLPLKKEEFESLHHRIMNPVELLYEQFQAFSEIGDAESREVLNAPFVVRNIFPMLGIGEERLEAVFNRQFLTAHFGDRRVDFYPHNMVEVQAHPYFLPLGPALRQLLHKPEEAYVGVDASEPGTYIQWNLDQETWYKLVVELLGGQLPAFLNDSWWADACFEKPSRTQFAELGEAEKLTIDEAGEVSTHSARSRHDEAPIKEEQEQEEQRRRQRTASHFMLSTHWQMLLIGEQGAGMFHHQDTLRTASWQLQLVGSKRWHLCGPEQSPFLYSAGEIDLFAPDYAAYPLLLNASCYDVTLYPGDLLYYPSDYWHQTINLETPSIALSSTLVTSHGYAGLIQELRRECDGAQRIFPPQPVMCAALEACYALWERRLRC